MIIFGTRATRKLLDKGSFTCPQCQDTTEFEKRRAREWFHLYFIPIIPLNTHPPYVECKRCKATFIEGVLNAATDAESQNIRAEFETATLEILARMAWADGVIEPEEIDIIEKVINEICAREFSRADVEKTIQTARTSQEDALVIATRVSPMLNENGKEMILQAVFLVANADGDFAREEVEMFMEIGAGLGMRPAHVKGVLGELIEQYQPAHNS